MESVWVNLTLKDTRIATGQTTGEPRNLSSELPLLMPKLQCLPRHLTLRWVRRIRVVEWLHRPRLRLDVLCSPLEVVDACPPAVGRFPSLPAGPQESYKSVKVPVSCRWSCYRFKSRITSDRGRTRNMEQRYSFQSTSGKYMSSLSSSPALTSSYHYSYHAEPRPSTIRRSLYDTVQRTFTKYSNKIWT